MSVDERRRHRMYRKLEEILGPEEAGILMEHLPPIGWGEVARKGDVEALGHAIRPEVEGLRVEMDRLEARVEAKLESKLNSQTKTLVGLMSAQVIAVAGLAFAAARFA